MDGRNNILTAAEIALTEKAVGMALDAGAQKCRMTLSKSVLDLAGTLNGELDKVTHCLDRSLSIVLLVDGRYGSFSTNRLEEEALLDFIRDAVETVRTLTVDPCRDLPLPERVARDAVRGDETKTYDPESYEALTPETLVEEALAAAVYGKASLPEGVSMISEEGELSVTISDSLLLDSQGTRCRCLDTLFEYGVEVTIEAAGEKVSGYWWDSSPWRKCLDAGACGTTAVRKAVEALGGTALPSGKYRMAVSTECASKLVTPLLNALGGFALQQKNSFLTDSLGKALFPERLTILDQPRVPGTNGARFYDSEGVATENVPVIDRGVVSRYFLNTYIAAKMGLSPTVEDAMRPLVVPTLPGVTLKQWCASVSGAMGSGELRSLRSLRPLPLPTSSSPCDNSYPAGPYPCPGVDMSPSPTAPLHSSTPCPQPEVSTTIIVEGFNGGNNNPATGAFSYGIEGRALMPDGSIVPVKEMLITGNFLTLWAGLVDVLDDARPCNPKSLPSLVFDGVDFSG